MTVFDNSPQQLAQDRYVARREGLNLATVEGDMRDLSAFADASFDLIVHPVSNVFVPDVHPVWREAYRVLRPGGTLLAGFCNPVMYLFDQELADQGILQVRHKLPYSDLTSLSDEERAVYVDEQQPLEFGHLLDRPDRRADRRRLSDCRPLRRHLARRQDQRIHTHLHCDACHQTKERIT